LLITSTGNGGNHSHLPSTTHGNADFLCITCPVLAPIPVVYSTPLAAAFTTNY